MSGNPSVTGQKHTVRKVILIGLAVLLAGFIGFILLESTIKADPQLVYQYGPGVAATSQPNQPNQTNQTSQPQGQPQCRFAVISDPHFYDTSLGTKSVSLQQYIENSGKLLLQSRDILDGAINRILQENVQFVLISGDLTKDGEKKDHEIFAKELTRLTDKGIKVYVVPGNHDILNPNASDYTGNLPVAASSITAAQFADIYKSCGYGDALYRDSGSLSYVAEPVSGVWLVCLDSCRYYDNAKYQTSIIDGKLTQGEIVWLEGILKKANGEGKTVIVMLHHGVVEHWKGQSVICPNYLLSDYTHVSKLLASYGVRLVFSGHYHAQDIAEADFGSKGFLLDVETGSLINTGCPIRICSIDSAQNFSYKSIKLAGTMYPGKLFDGKDFSSYAYNLFNNATYKRESFLLEDKKIDASDIKAIAENLTEAYMAHNAGDENLAQRHVLDLSRLQQQGRAVLLQNQSTLDGLWNDPSVKNDNNGWINLVTGKHN
jgi:3',5'-cyclic AMP phosphodiesterase CpdA